MTPEFLALYDSGRWKDTRYRIINRDRGACRVCGAKQILVVHHVRYTTPHPADEPGKNLITLCHHCHEKVHGKAPIPAHTRAAFGDLINQGGGNEQT